MLLVALALRADALSLSPSLFCLHSEFFMSILKSALVACVMTTSAMLVGYLLPVVINPASAQAFPPCRNDFRAEIAAGQRSPHYPRCLDAHSPRGPSLQGEPQIENQAFNCPSGQVFSGGACVTIQNQWTNIWGQCVYRDWAADKSRLTINGTNYLCNKTANSVQALCCPT